MATRKEPIDIAYNEPQQEAVSGSAESNGPYESQDEFRETIPQYTRGRAFGPIRAPQRPINRDRKSGNTQQYIL